MNIDIRDRVKEHYKYVCENYGEKHILGVFPYGSMNYNLFCNDSDVDTKAIYIPNFDDLVSGKRPNEELHILLPNNSIELCEVKDIRDMVYNFEKANVNFLEILFTSYAVYNPKIDPAIWQENFLFANKKIVEGRVYEMCKAAAGQAIHTARQIPSSPKTAPKKISNVFRLSQTISKYLETLDFKHSITFDGKEREILLDYKYDPNWEKNYNSEDFKVALAFCQSILSMEKEEFYEKYHIKKSYIDIIRTSTSVTMQRGASNIIKMGVKKELVL